MHDLLEAYRWAFRFLSLSQKLNVLEGLREINPGFAKLVLTDFTDQPQIPETWQDAVIEAIEAGANEEKFQRLVDIGIVNADGSLTDKYRSGTGPISRAADED